MRFTQFTVLLQERKMKKLMVLPLAVMAALTLCASVHAGWQLKYIRDSAASPFVPTAANAWFANWVPGYPDFYLRKNAANGVLTLHIKGVTFEQFSYYMEQDVSALLKLTVAAAPPITLNVQLTDWFRSAVPYLTPQMDITWKGLHGAQPNITIAAVKTTTAPGPTVSLGNINILYGRPLIAAKIATFPANYFGEVTVTTDGGIKMLNVFGGIVRKVTAKNNIGAIYVRRVNNVANGIIYGGILGGAAGHATADIYTQGTIGYIFANGGLGSAVRNGVPQVQEPTVCAGWDGTAATYPNGIATIVAPSGGLNSLICAGSGPVTFVYGGAIRTILLGNQNGGVLNTCRFEAGPKPKIAGPGKALAVASSVETNLGSIPINAAY